MPFAESKHQRLSTPLVCNASASFVEISSNIFTPGATKWDQIMAIPEYQTKMQLFIYYLECLQKISAEVAIETLVSNDFDRLHHSKLDPSVRVLGYRIWALISEENKSVFCKQLYKSVSTGLDIRYRLKRGTKKARVESVESHQKIPESDSELLSILRMYGMGIETEEFEILSPSMACGKTGIKALSITEFLSAQRQMDAKTYQKRCDDNDMYEKQRNISTYVRDGLFFPLGLTSGLIRCCRIGPGRFLSNSALDLYNYFLPAYEPSIFEIKSKLTHMLTSSGLYTDLDRMTRNELIEFADARGITSVFSEENSHKSGARLIDSSDMTNIRLNDIAKHYNTTRVLYDQYCVRLRGLSCVDNTTRFFRDVRNTLQVVLSGGIDGVPVMYSELTADKNIILSMLEGTGGWQKKCKSILSFVSHKEKTTGLSNLMIKIHSLVTSSLLLTKKQQWMFMLMYTRHFITSYHHDSVITSIIISGKNGSGKSHVIKTLGQCISPSLVVCQDTKTSTINTCDGSSNDLRIVFIDDLDKPGCSRILEDDLTLSTSGITTHHGVKVTHGQKNVDITQTIRRGLTVAATAHPDKLSPAIASRSVFIPMIETETEVERSEGITSTMLLDESVAEDEHAAKVAMSFMSARQVSITAPQSLGAFPVLDVTCVRVFIAMHEERYGRNVIETRLTMELTRLAHAIKNWNDISLWHERGVGAKYGFDTVVELMWYASRQFIRMEEVCVAYVLLAQAQSLDAHIRDIAIILKRCVLVEEGVMVRNGSHYFTTMRTAKEMNTVLKKIQRRLGVGLFNKCIDTINGLVIRGEPVVKYNSVQAERGCILIHAEWLAQVNTPAEDALIKTLHHLIKTNNVHVNMDYDTEKLYVFDAYVRRCIKNPTHDTVLPGLENESPSEIVQALSFLYDKKTITGLPVVCDYEHIKSARLSTMRTPSSIPSLLYPSMYKIAHLEYLHIVIRPELFEPCQQSGDTNLLIKDALIIAGGYTDRQVYVGALDECINITPTDITDVEIDNVYYRDTKDDVYDDLKLARCEELFPDKLKRVRFDQNSNIDSVLRKKAMARIPLEKTMVDFFETADAL